MQQRVNASHCPHSLGPRVQDRNFFYPFLFWIFPAAWARVCKIMGPKFEPYLPLVMGPVMRTASLKPEVALLDNEDMHTVDSDEDWQFVSLGEQQNFGEKKYIPHSKINCTSIVLV